MTRDEMIERARQFGFEDTPLRASGMAADFALQEIERERAERLAEIKRKLDVANACLGQINNNREILAKYKINN